MLNFLKKKIETYYHSKIYTIYFCYIILVSLLSLFFGINLIERIPNLTVNNDIIIKNIPFGYGPLIENIIKGNGYYQEWQGTKSYLVRFPFIPIFLTFLFKVSTNLYFILIFKNIIFFSIIFFSLYIFCKSLNKKYLIFFTILIIFFYNFYNLTTLLNFVFADAYIGIILPSMYLILISKYQYRHVVLSIFIFFLFFMKTTVFLSLFAISILFVLLEKNLNILRRFIPIFIFIISVLIWGFFGYSKTGVFPIGAKVSSDNQLALSITLNKNFHKYYPLKSVDLIPRKKVNIKFQDEWEMYNYYKKINKDYIENNKKQIFKDILSKIKFVLFNVKKDAVYPDENGNFNNPFMFSHFYNRLIAIISIFLFLFALFKKGEEIRNKKIDIYFIVIYITSITPHIIGWCTSKHLVGIFLITHVYVLLKIYDKFLEKNDI